MKQFWNMLKKIGLAYMLILIGLCIGINAFFFHAAGSHSFIKIFPFMIMSILGTIALIVGEYFKVKHKESEDLQEKINNCKSHSPEEVWNEWTKHNKVNKDDYEI